jgi:hypothetical protein
MSTILKNKYLHLAVAFVVGGAVMKLFAVEEIRVETKEVVKWRTKIVEVEKEVRVVENVEKTKETKPDGTIIEREVTNRTKDSETSVSKDLKESETSTELVKVHTNPRSTLLYGGVGTNLDLDISYTVGVSTTLWGPVNVGFQVAGPPGGLAFYGTVGLEF